MAKALITTVPFGEGNRLPLDLLENAGIEYLINPYNRSLLMINCQNWSEILMLSLTKPNRLPIGLSSSLRTKAYLSGGYWAI